MAEPVLTADQWERAARAHGWYEQNEAELLYRLVAGPWCEVGCWKGRSTAVLAQTGFPGWAVDWFKGSSEHGDVDTYDEFRAHMSGYTNVTVLRMRAEDAVKYVDGPVNLLHLDAEHSYEATASVFVLYAPLVVKGGHCVLHDAWSPGGGRKIGRTPWPGVTKFALELEQHPDWDLVASVGRCAAFRRI